MKFVGAVSKFCSCGHEFKPQDKANIPVEIKVYDKGGKGKKECSQCHKFVGAVTQTCICGFDFKAAKQAVKDAKTAAYHAACQQANMPENRPVITPALAAAMLGCKSTIVAPAGACPCALKSTEPEAIDEWVGDVRQAFRSKGQFLTLSGLIYFIHQFFNMFGPEYPIVKAHLETTLGSERACGLA